MQQRSLIDVDEPGIFSYYNTLSLTGKALAEAKYRAGTQGHRVLGFFKAHRGEDFTPAEVWKRLNMLPTSCRRAISDLTDDELLTKTDTMRAGAYGADNHCWVMD